MKLLTRIRQYRVYRRLVLSYLLLSVVTITVLSTILYTTFSARAVEEIDHSSKQMLAQVSYTANVVFGQVQTITNQLLSDNEILTLMYAKSNSKTVDYAVSLLLGKIRGMYPYIKNLSIYNLTTGAYIDTLGQPPDPGMLMKDEASYFGFFPRKVESLSKVTLRLLTFKIIPERSFTEVPNSAIVVDLDETYIRNTIQNISASSRDSETFVMDASGTVLSHSNPEYFMNEFSKLDYVKKILASHDSQGSLVQNIDNQKHLITYVKSANLDWFFVNVRPYTEIITNINELRDWTILVAAILVVAGAAFSLLLTGNIYNPIKVLLEKVSSTGKSGNKALLRFDEYQLLTDAFTQSIESNKSMESTLNRSSRVLKDSYISQMLKGNANKIAVSAEMKREWESHFTGPYLTIVLFKIDGYRTLKEQYIPIDMGIIRFAISNIANELLGKSYTSDVASMEEDEISVFIQSNKNQMDDNLYLILGEIMDTVRSYYQIGLSVSIGDSCSSISEVSDSYKSAQAYMTSRLFLGHGCVASTANSHKIQESQAHYPASIEKRLIDAVKLGHQVSIRTEIKEFIALLSGCTYANAIQYTSFLVLGIIKEFDYITKWWSVDSEQLYRTVNEVRETETLVEIESMISGLCSRVVDILEENKKNTTTAKNAKLIEQIQQFVRQHYAEHGLSLEAAADHVGFSSGYIGKLFKYETGTTFNDYVTHIRMEKAKIFLAATNDSIAQIGERVGVYNVPYFATLFKKKYGITPSQFREQAPPIG